MVDVRFVTTRYQGSKQRALVLIERALSRLQYDSVVDVFGGSGTVAHFFKRLGKQVHYNDSLRANAWVGRALIQNSRPRLDERRARSLFERAAGKRYDDFIARTFEGIYFTSEENRQLDVVAQNIHGLRSVDDKAVALYALFQACLKKRPYNLFHRRNLELRTRDVVRSFGNKTTWERPLLELFLAALGEAHGAIFDNGRQNVASCEDALSCPLDADLVYLDPPYVRSDGKSFDYLEGYHFLEGLSEYGTWPRRIDHERKHLPYQRQPSAFCHPKTIGPALSALLDRARRAPLVVLSYRNDGIPDEQELRRLMRTHGRKVRCFSQATTYALSVRQSRELVLVGRRTC